jgi:site-specific recombinase XerD
MGILADWDRWMKDERDFTDATRSGYMHKIQTTQRWLGCDITQASTEQLREFILSRAKPITREAYRQSLGSLFRYLCSVGERNDNPTLGLPVYRRHRGLPRPYSAVNLTRYLNAAASVGPRELVMGLLGSDCGLRVSEAAKVQWSDIEDAGLRVRGKGRKERIVPVGPVMRQALSAWGFECPSARFIFPGPRGHLEAGTLLKLHHELLEVAGLRTHDFGQDGFHRLRHSFATEALIASGYDLLSVQQLCGHSSPATTQIYALVASSRRTEVVQAMYQGRLFEL